MFKKLNIKIDETYKKKIAYLQKFIESGKTLYKDDTIDFAFKTYDPDTDENKVYSQYIDKYTIYKQIEFPYKPIINILPEYFLKLENPHVHWQTFDGGSLVPPHIDKGRISVINLYTQVNQEKTIVYKKIRNGVKLETINGLITNESFVPEWIEEIGSFVANQWDAYLLNVNSPHSVINMTDKRRISISFSFYNTSYKELLDVYDVQKIEI